MDGVTITSAAAKQIKTYLTKRGKGIGIRLGVKTSGCSGMSYVLEYIDKANEEDEVFEYEDVKVAVDPKSLIYLRGTQMDFVRQGLSEGFEFSNPNSRNACGCGESFMV
jgi:iron-sulfur cluster assembly protein